MNRTTATHEAGHAIGRLLTAKMLDIPFEEAVAHVDVDAAVCYGPIAPHALLVRVSEKYGTVPAGDGFWTAAANTATRSELFAIVWSRMLFIAMGAAAEARLARLSDATPIFFAPQCRADLRDFVHTSSLLGTTNIGASAYILAYLNHSMRLLEEPAVWLAVHSVAAELRDAKANVTGFRIAELARPYLDQAPDLLGDPLPEGIREVQESPAMPSRPTFRML